MSDYIERAKALGKLCLDHNDVVYIDKRECAKRIEKIKGIDLVRCKDCKHWSYGKDICNLHDMGMVADDFCSYGEVRDE